MKPTQTKILSLGLALSMILALVACGNNTITGSTTAPPSELSNPPVPESTASPDNPTEPPVESTYPSAETSDLPPDATTNRVGAYDYDELYERRYDGHEVEYGTFLNNLQVPKSLSINDVEYQYISGHLTAIITLNLAAGQDYHINQNAEMQDYIIMFALFEDLQNIEYSYTQNDYSFGATVTRSQANEAFGGDISQLVLSKEMFAGEFADELEDLNYSLDVKSIISYDNDIMYKRES